MAAQDGFTLIELLVVVIIIGMLAAIAIVAFLNQQKKARDVEAKSGAREAVTAMESYGIEHDGFDTVTLPELINVEPTLQDAPNLAIVGAPTKRTYTLETKSNSSPQVTFTVDRQPDGTLDRSCTPNPASCPGGTW